jgi:hypothetical protein
LAQPTSVPATAADIAFVQNDHGVPLGGGSVKLVQFGMGDKAIMGQAASAVTW